MTEGSALYHRQITERGNDLMHQVWDGTPWMTDAYTGSIENDGRYGRMMRWCRDHFGPEAWPIHGKPGNWYSGGATVLGWTWMGFRTREMMEQFLEAWGNPQDEPAEWDLSAVEAEMAGRKG